MNEKVRRKNQIQEEIKEFIYFMFVGSNIFDGIENFWCENINFIIDKIIYLQNYYNVKEII